MNAEATLTLTFPNFWGLQFAAIILLFFWQSLLCAILHKTDAVSITYLPLYFIRATRWGEGNNFSPFYEQVLVGTKDKWFGSFWIRSPRKVPNVTRCFLNTLSQELPLTTLFIFHYPLLLLSQLGLSEHSVSEKSTVKF